MVSQGSASLYFPLVVKLNFFFFLIGVFILHFCMASKTLYLAFLRLIVTVMHLFVVVLHIIVFILYLVAAVLKFSFVRLLSLLLLFIFWWLFCVSLLLLDLFEVVLHLSVVVMNLFGCFGSFCSFASYWLFWILLYLFCIYFLPFLISLFLCIKLWVFCMDSFFVVACFESFLHNLPVSFYYCFKSLWGSLEDFVVFLTRHISSHFKPLLTYVWV